MALIAKQTPEVTVYGPYVRTYKRGQQRRQVVLRFPDGRTTSMPYARWLMEEHLGRQLKDDEHVDHVDEDAMNDDLGNLQVLTPAANTIKSHPLPEMITFICPACGGPATKRAAQVRANRKRGMAGPFCNKVCARQWQINSRS